MTSDFDMHRAMLNSIPSLVFAMGEYLEIIECNQAAEEYLQESREALLRRRGGEVLRCLVAQNSRGGCGRGEECRHCIIRQSVAEAFAGNKVVRRRAHMQRIIRNKTEDFYCLVTATPFDIQSRRYALVVLEDISDLTELQRIVPICMNCRKVRDDDDYWRNVETYFQRHWDLRFSHGLCPECTRKEFEKLDRELPPHA